MIFIVGSVLIGSCKVVHAQDIDLDKIAMIESQFDPDAFNKYSGAVGEYQILPVVVEEFNERAHAPLMYNSYDMYNEKFSLMVANWYLNVRIPQYLKHYGIPDTVTSRLIAYNWGIGHLHRWFERGCHWNKLPRETQQYVKKYFKK